MGNVCMFIYQIMVNGEMAAKKKKELKKEKQECTELVQKSKLEYSICH